MKNLVVVKGAGLLKSLGNAKRLEILWCLREKEHSVGALEKKVGLSQSALSQHLAVLRAARVVKTRREAQTIYYSLRSEAAVKILNLLDKIYNQPYKSEYDV